MIKLRLLTTAVFVVSSVYGQSFTAALRGTITDASGAAVPSAKINVIESERNVSHPTVADPSGRYFLTALPPGPYSMTVEAPGFKKFQAQAFQLVVQQQATIDVRLEVGDVSSVVNVEETAPLLNTTNASLGQVVDNKYMVSMPNIGRDSLFLAYMTPGVVGSAGRRGDNSTNFVANGARNSTSDVMVDGVTVTTVEQNSGVTDLKYKPSVDAVQEFKMQTNFFPAEYGQTGGAVVNMVTKSGTNDFHGTGFYFLRHNDLNANNWFANRNGAARPNFRLDQFGGVLGGPVKKNKTFFFATYQQTKSKNPTSQTATFPTDPQRTGDFSQTFQSNGQLISVYDPFATTTNAAGQLERQVFAGNRIPASRIDPVAAKVMAFFPRQNQVTNAVTNVNNWFAQGVNQNTNKQMDFKGDHNFSDKNRLTARYSHLRSAGTPANLFGDGNPAFTFNDGPNGTKTSSVVADFTRAQSATSVWTVRYGLVYSNFFRNPMEAFDPTSLGLPSYYKSNATNLVFPTFAPGGFTDIGTEGWVVMDRQEGVHQISGSYSKFLGSHTIKAGGEFRHFFLGYLQPGYPSGQFSFDAQVTRQLQNVNNNFQGSGLATMLLGWGTGGQFHIDPKAHTRSRYMGMYVQDDWKITRKLTLNLGLRYEFDVPRWEKENRQSYLDLDAPSPLKVPGMNLVGVLKFNDENRRSPFNGDYNNFSPRIGLAYAINNKTSMRAGWGLLYSLSRATVYGHLGTGFLTNFGPIFSLDSNATRYATLDNPYPAGMVLPPGRSLGDATFIGQNLGAPLPSSNRNPEYYSWNYSIQRELPGNGILEVNYTGSRGAHLFYPFTNLAPLPLSTWYPGTPGAFTRDQLNASVPNPFFGYITDPRAPNMSRQTIQRFRLLRNFPQYDGINLGTAEPPSANSYYHALQMKYEKRFSKGLTFVGHYTWSKTIDDSSISSGNTSWLGGSTSLQNPLNRKGEKSLSAHDIAHRMVLTGAYQLPFGKGRKFGAGVNRLTDLVIGGWEVSAFSLFQGGNPLQVSQNGGILQNGTQRPNLIGDPSMSGPIVNRLNGYYNNAAFTNATADTFGTAPRYINYRGPGIKTIDMALLKSFRVTEGQRFEFRLEAVNATNTPIFGDPASAFGAANFGAITGTKIGPRNVQLGFKYYF
jgi:hypothetical protein